MKKIKTIIQRIVADISMIITLASFIGGIVYAAWYAASFELRLNNIEDKQHEILKKVDDASTICNECVKELEQ